jgi:hypothetical protein
MAWARIDDRFFSHPKVRRAGKDAALLYLAGLTYCNEHLTNGFIPEESLAFIALAGFVDDAKQSASKLLEVCLWESVTNGYQVHDYFEYNPTREMVEETKQARAIAGRKGGKAKAASNPSKKLANVKQNSSNIPSPPLQLKEKKHGAGAPSEVDVRKVSPETLQAAYGFRPGPPDPVPDWMPPDCHDLCAAFIDASGIKPISKEKSGWIKEIRNQHQMGLSPGDIRAAVSKMRQDGLTIADIFSVTRTARALKANPTIKTVTKSDAYGNPVEVPA